MAFPAEFVVDCYTKRFVTETDGEAIMVFSFWPDPISINSVLVIFRVRVFVFNQVCTFSRSSLRETGSSNGKVKKINKFDATVRKLFTSHGG